MEGGLRVTHQAPVGTPPVSIVTVVYNGAATLERTIQSVLGQDFPGIEYIIVDGGSTDGTLDIIRKYGNRLAYWCSAKDKGIYDAMNKGLALATGDYVGFLNSDDYFTSPASLAKLAAALKREVADAVIGDIEQVNANGRIVRVFRGNGFKRENLRRGSYPPHPAFYARPEMLRKLGGFDTSFRIAADFDLMIRFFNAPKVRWAYVPDRIVTMRIGGASHEGFAAYLKNSREIVRACKTRGLKPSYPRIYGRIVSKGLQVVSGLAGRRS